VEVIFSRKLRSNILLPKVSDLTDTDVKILLSAISRKTLTEIVDTTGISFSYCRDRVTKLKNRNYLKEVDKRDRAPVYQTCRLSETEAIFDLYETASNTNGKLYRIPDFYGQHLTLAEAGKFVNDRRSKLRGSGKPLFDVILTAIAVLKVRSFRKSQGEIAVQHPHEEEMRDILLDHINQAKRELRLAEEIYNTKFLWSGSENIWRIISDGPPSNMTSTRYQNAADWFRPEGTQATQPVVVSQSAKDKRIAEILAEGNQ
jgi:DNA-binding Lrp family transcriptional regulator